ncbi:MAG: hypothetical protein P8047_05130 [Gammaproteobacteria bacterium]
MSGEEFPNKPIMLMNTSPRAHHALDALREVLETMSGNIIESAAVSIPLLGSKLDKNGILADRHLTDLLHVGLSRFCDEILCIKREDSATGRT